MNGIFYLMIILINQYNKRSTLMYDACYKGETEQGVGEGVYKNFLPAKFFCILILYSYFEK